MLDLDTKVWKRKGHNTMSRRLFALMVSFWTAAGIITCAIAAAFTVTQKLETWMWIALFIACLWSIRITVRNNNPVISILGYAVIAVSMGLILGPSLAQYTAFSVIKILFVTTCITVGLGIIGAVIPADLDSWLPWILGALIMSLIGYYLLAYASLFGMQVEQALTVWDWIGVFIFGACVVFDWNRAMRVPYTMNNSIDAGLQIFLDFLNLFLILLRLKGSKSS